MLLCYTVRYLIITIAYVTSTPEYRPRLGLCILYYLAVAYLDVCRPISY